MLRHHTGQRWYIDGAWQGYSNLNDVLQRSAHLLKVSTARRHYDQIVLRAIRKEHAKGILPELSRNGTFCRHETTCSTRDVVQRSVLKAFLLGRNTCWRGIARNRHVLMEYYEEKGQVKGVKNRGEGRAHCLYTDWAETVQIVRAPLPSFLPFPFFSHFLLRSWEVIWRKRGEGRGENGRRDSINRCSLWKKTLLDLLFPFMTLPQYEPAF